MGGCVPAAGAVDLELGGQPRPLTLRGDMQVGDVIRTLLATNVVCVDSEGEQSFQISVAPASPESGVVTVEGAPASPSGGSGPFCILLEDLLEAPRKMPLECLVSDSNEECQLYEDTPEPYIDREPSSELMSRLPWLVGLLLFLTVSSAILEFYDAVLQRHLVIAFYLTALVGCGGNSGSQAASLILQALATGELRPTVADVLRVAEKELLVGLGAAVALSLGVVARMICFGSPLEDAAIIAIAMAFTVLFSVLFGALTPLLLKRLGFDPAKVSGPLLSTTIDIFGVLAACISAQLLESVGYLH